GGAHRRGRRRAVPRLSPLPDHPLERPPGPCLSAARAIGTSREYRPLARPSAAPARAVRDPHVPRPAARSASPLLRELRGLSDHAPAEPSRRSGAARRARSVPGGARALRGRAGRGSRSDESCGSPDVPRRALDEAGPDEHGGLWPVNTGGRIRSFHMLRELSRRHHVTLLTTHAPSEDTGALEAALPQCEVVSVPWALAKRGSARFALALVGSWLSSLPVDLYKARVPALGRELARRL